MWRLASVPSSAAVDVPVPSAWRALSAAWVDCTGQCQAAWVAGWDGKHEVLIGKIQRETLNATWKFRHHFAVRPDLGRCVGGKGQCSSRAPSSYSDVMSLHLGGNISSLTLLILLGGGVAERADTFLDAWDLSRGKMLGRWRSNGRHTSMCADGQQFLLVSSGLDGPVIRAAPMPDVLRERLSKSDSTALEF